MIFLRALAGKPPSVIVLEKIKEICNKILISSPIAKELRSKAYVEGMSSLIILRKLKEFRQIKKLKKCKKTSIDKARKLIDSENCKKPTDRSDLKFIEAALAEKAILITKDHVLLNLNPYNCGKISLRIISPEEYLSRNS